jgi:hypothetical protein
VRTQFSRARRISRVDALSRSAFRVLLVLVALICLIALAGGLLIGRKKGPDLFVLTPKVSSLDGYATIAWYDLEGGPQAHKAGGVSTGTPARVLGYMMSGTHPSPDGQLITCFVLLPDAGSPVHAARRFGDQMIEVNLQPGDSVRFSEGSIVWVWGTWEVFPGDPAGPRPLYGLRNARVQPANKADISKFFR